MDATSAPILEIGLILLAAVGGRLGRPAARTAGHRRLPRGRARVLAVHARATSPTTTSSSSSPTVGVVLLLFEVGIEVDLGRLRRDQRPLLWAAPLQVVISTGLPAAVFDARGPGPGCRGAGRAVRRAVVVGRHRQHHGQPAAHHRPADRGSPCSAGPSCRTSSGSSSARSCSPCSRRPIGRCPRRSSVWWLFGVMTVAGRPDPAARPARPPRRARPVPDHLGRDRTDARRDRLRWSSGCRWRSRPSSAGSR